MSTVYLIFIELNNKCVNQTRETVLYVFQWMQWKDVKIIKDDVHVSVDKTGRLKWKSVFQPLKCRDEKICIQTVYGLFITPVYF